MKWHHRLVAMLLAVALVAMTMPSTSFAASNKREACASAQKVGTKVPVVMVHGWNDTGETWTKPKASMQKALSNVEGVYLPAPFDYKDHNHEWVIHPEIGDKLADTISCLAAASRKGGGYGKVIVVAHSMGGLAAKLAVSQVAPYVDLVITLGTPYRGSGFANGLDLAIRAYCVANPIASAFMAECKTEAYAGLSISSRKAAELPVWPDPTAVLAIGSDVNLPLLLLDGFLGLKARIDTQSDLFVPKPSALAEGKETSFGGGKRLFRCRATSVDPQSAACWHSQLMNYRPIQKAVKEAIQNYLAYLQGVSIQFAGLNLTVPSGWKVTQSGPNFIEVKDTHHCGSRKTQNGEARDWCPWFMIYKDIATQPSFGSIPCDNGPSSEVKIDQAITSVGGQTARKYVVACPSDPPKYLFRLWHVADKHVLIQGEDGGMLSSRLSDARWN